MSAQTETKAERNARLIKGYGAGKAVWEMAQEEGLTRARVYNILRDSGVRMRERGRIPKTQRSAPLGRPLVIIESPWQGGREEHRVYLASCLKDSIARGEAPFASHGLYTMPGVLDDTVEAERELGMTVGHEVMRRAALVVVCTDLGITPGMVRGIETASRLGKKLEFRRLG